MASKNATALWPFFSIPDVREILIDNSILLELKNCFSVSEAHARRVAPLLAALKWENVMADEKQTVVKAGGSNIGLIFVALAIVLAAAVAFMFLQNEKSKTDAISGAATAVGDAAKDVGDAVKPE